MDTLNLRTMYTDLCKVSYGDVIDKEYKVAILPWGATEPHNYHLPYTTDAILSHAISVDAANAAFEKDKSLAMVLPPVYYGSQNPGQRQLPFCIHGRYETQYAILLDIVESLRYQGINKLIIVNGHGGNSFKNMIRDLAVLHPDFLACSCEWYTLAKECDFFEELGEHANELETSVMLYYHPDLVDMTQAGMGKSRSPKLKPLANGTVWMPRNWSEVSEDTGIGNPYKSTAEKGERFVEAVIKRLANAICDIANY
ncbi:MAG: creatininase family protein [Bacteroidales bacterium]